MKKSEAVLKMLTKIPRGKVTSYGALAAAADSSPRAVGQIMKRNEHPEKYPCYKVISSSGKLGGYDGRTEGKAIERKVALLRKDGIEIRNGKIDRKYFHMF